MSMEDTSRAGKSSPDGSEKKSKKGHKRKVQLGAEKNDAECNNEVPELDDAVLLGTNEVQSVPPLKRNKREEKTLQDVKQQVWASREETQENVQQRGPKQKKRLKFNLESSVMLSDQEKRDSVMVHGNEATEENKPSNTSWVQKASWKSLVGESGRVAFSLGSMLGHDPSFLPSGNIKSMTADVRQPSTKVQSSNNVSAWIDGSTSAPSFENSGQSNNHSIFSHAKTTSKIVKKSEAENDSGSLNHHSVKIPPAQGSLKGDPQKFERAKHENANSHDFKQMVQNDCESGVEKVCTFMRSDNYEQEWLEAKRAVKEIFKRSRKDALRSMKMFHTKYNQ